MPEALRARVDFEDAVMDDVLWRPDLIPRPLTSIYASDALEVVTEFAERAAASPDGPGRLDELIAYKWRRGRRPVAMIPLEYRVQYAGVVTSMSDDLPRVRRPKGSYKRFIKRPLVPDTVSHVVVTDIANYFSSIPIEFLRQHLNRRTSAIDAVEWLSSFWRSTSGKEVGIPQVNRASDRVAEAYADELEQRLLQRGLLVVRHSDDFRVGTTSQQHAVEALDIFDEEARKMGLSINERKTYIQSRDKYAQKVDRLSRDETDFMKEIRDRLTDVDMYSNQPIPPDEARVSRDAADQMLQLWAEEEMEKDYELDADAAKLAGRALRVLATLNDPSALSSCANLVRFDPQLMPEIGRYMRAAAQVEPGKTRESALQIIRKLSLSRWQRLWVLAIFEGGGARGDEEIINWMRREATAGTGPLVRSFAAWSLACNYSLDLSVWRQSAEQTDLVSAPYLAGAIANCNRIGTPLRRRFAPRGFIERRIFEWVSEGNAIPDEPF